jgi:hypothetical protein
MNVTDYSSQNNDKKDNNVNQINRLRWYVNLIHILLIRRLIRTLQYYDVNLYVKNKGRLYKEDFN